MVALPTISLAIWLALVSEGITQIALPTVSCNGQTTSDCYVAVKRAMSDPSQSPVQVALAWGAWVQRYEQAYRAMSKMPVPQSDLDRLEKKVEDKLGSYTNPADISLDQALKRFFPRIAAMMAFLDGAPATFVYTLLAPSPTSTPIDELKSFNDDLAFLWTMRLSVALRPSWRADYNQSILDSLNIKPPKP